MSTTVSWIEIVVHYTDMVNVQTATNVVCGHRVLPLFFSKLGCLGRGGRKWALVFRQTRNIYVGHRERWRAVQLDPHRGSRHRQVSAESGGDAQIFEEGRSQSVSKSTAFWHNLLVLGSNVVHPWKDSRYRQRACALMNGASGQMRIHSGEEGCLKCTSSMALHDPFETFF